MKIAIDVDEVLADLIHPIIAFHNEARGTNLTLDHYVSYEFSEVWGCTREESIAHVRDFFASPHFAEIKPMPGAVAAIQKLRQDHELAVVTSRQSVIEHETRVWLEKHFPQAFAEVHFTNLYSLTGDANKQGRTKKEICQEIGADAFIDDAPANVRGCAELGIPVYMFEYPWNRQVQDLPENVRRVNSWREVTSLLKSSQNML